MIVDVKEVLTPSELASYEQAVTSCISAAHKVGRSDIAERLQDLVNEAKEQTCQVYQSK